MLALRVAGEDEHRRGDPADGDFDICSGDDNGFPDFSDANALLEGIDFDDLFVGMDEDVLPDLELLADFSVNTSPSPEIAEEQNRNKCSVSGSGSGSDESSGGEEIASKKGENGKNGNNSNNSSSSPKEGQEKSRKSSSSHSKNGKRKVKVDWTPELHRRFVQAVEQIGVDKAVPSRILELMGIDCLTRHNIASHLQKYRSHRKHLLAREAEAASWTQRRQMYGGGGKRPDMNPWLAPPPTRPIMGFPPMAPPPPPPPSMHHFRPLHVWGHPSMDRSAMHMWPKHLSPPRPQPWAPPESPFWHHQRVPTALTPCFPPPPMRFGAPPVQGIPPQAMYKDPGGVGTAGAGVAGPPPRPLIDLQPSKESIDAAIGDVLSKPWLPLPLGLKPPSTDSVMVELHRHGVPKIPPPTTCA